jgi:hemoglobin
MLGLALAALGMFLAPAPRSFAQMKKMEPMQMKMPGAPAAKDSLYTRMGGYDAIAAVVDGFIHQLGHDPAFKRFGGGRGLNSELRTRQLIVDQICEMTGGPCIYLGRDMKTAHGGLGITPVEWDSSVHKWKVSLTEQHVGAPEQKEFIAMIQKLRPDIVAKPKTQSKEKMYPAKP